MMLLSKKNFHLFILFSEKYLDYVIEPAKVDLPLLHSNKTKILSMDGGRAHTVLLTDNEGGQYIFVYLFQIIYLLNVTAIQGWAGKFIWWHYICCWWAICSKHCNTDEKRVQPIRRTMLKNKPDLIKFYESICASLWTFQLTFI